MRRQIQKIHDKVTADTISRAILDRLASQEKQIAALRKIVDEHFEAFAEQGPRLTASGQLMFSRILRDQSDSLEEATVLVSGTIIEGKKP